MDLLIKNARIIDSKKDIKGDVFVKDGIITDIDINGDKHDEKEDIRTINANGLVLMPSFIDMHCHLRDPGFLYKEDLESGQKSALKGGFTTLCAMANTKPVCDSLDIIRYVINKSKKLNLCDIIQISSVTEGLNGKKIVDVESIVKQTKLFSDDGKTIFSDNIMKEILKLSLNNGFTILTHCQPEFEIVKRDLKFLDDLGGNLHICHISLNDTLCEIIKYKDKGLKFSCEVTPHHIFGSNIDYKVNPPFRKQKDRLSLIQGIKNGYIDVIGTDHAPHSKLDKENGSPGISNIEVAFSIINTTFKENNISLQTLSKMMSYNPAQILNIDGGLIEKGYIGNLVLIDSDETYKIDTQSFISKGKNNPFDGRKVKGKVKMTIKEGIIKYNDM